MSNLKISDSHFTVLIYWIVPLKSQGRKMHFPTAPNLIYVPTFKKIDYLQCCLLQKNEMVNLIRESFAQDYGLCTRKMN